MKRIYLICALVIMGIAIILLTACSHLKEDKETIVKYLNDVYGKDSYTMERDPEYKYNYFVKLKEYPELKFMITVSRQPFMLPHIWSDFDEVFSKHAINEFKDSKELYGDEITYLDPGLIYRTKVSSIEELKMSYDRFTDFIDFVSEKYPIMVDSNLLDIRMDVRGILLKGDIEYEIKYFDVCENQNGKLNIKTYDEIYAELAPKIKTQNASSKGFVFKASDGRSFSLGADTFEDCLYKELELENADANELKNIILEPGETSGTYTFKSKGNYDFVNIEIQAKNLTSQNSSLYDATIIKAVITGAEEIYIEPVWINLKFNAWDEATGGKWIDPYDALKILPPKTEAEKSEGVPYKNIRVLFEEQAGEDWKEIKRVILTLK